MRSIFVGNHKRNAHHFFFNGINSRYCMSRSWLIFSGLYWFICGLCPQVAGNAVSLKWIITYISLLKCMIVKNSRHIIFAGQMIHNGTFCVIKLQCIVKPKCLLYIFFLSVISENFESAIDVSVLCLCRLAWCTCSILLLALVPWPCPRPLQQLAG